MKKILISLIVSFVIMATGVILIIVAAAIKNQPVLVAGLCLLIASSFFYTIIGIILLRAWLTKKGA